MNTERSFSFLPLTYDMARATCLFFWIAVDPRSLQEFIVPYATALILAAHVASPTGAPPEGFPASPETVVYPLSHPPPPRELKKRSHFECAAVDEFCEGVEDYTEPVPEQPQPQTEGQRAEGVPGEGASPDKDPEDASPKVWLTPFGPSGGGGGAR